MIRQNAWRDRKYCLIGGTPFPPQETLNLDVKTKDYFPSGQEREDCRRCRKPPVPFSAVLYEQKPISSIDYQRYERTCLQQKKKIIFQETFLKLLLLYS
jgi:hypothetical protein